VLVRAGWRGQPAIVLPIGATPATAFSERVARAWNLQVSIPQRDWHVAGGWDTVRSGQQGQGSGQWTHYRDPNAMPLLRADGEGGLKGAVREVFDSWVERWMHLGEARRAADRQHVVSPAVATRMDELVATLRRPLVDKHTPAAALDQLEALLSARLSAQRARQQEERRSRVRTPELIAEHNRRTLLATQSQLAHIKDERLRGHQLSSHWGPAPGRFADGTTPSLGAIPESVVPMASGRFVLETVKPGVVWLRERQPVAPGAVPSKRFAATDAMFRDLLGRLSRRDKGFVIVLGSPARGLPDDALAEFGLLESDELNRILRGAGWNGDEPAIVLPMHELSREFPTFLRALAPRLKQWVYGPRAAWNTAEASLDSVAMNRPGESGDFT
jgi:hypothetical protein